MERCHNYNHCNATLCPLDNEIESRVSYLCENCREFPSISGLLSDEQKKAYISALNRLKEDKA